MWSNGQEIIKNMLKNPSRPVFNPPHETTRKASQASTYSTGISTITQGDELPPMFQRQASSKLGLKFEDVFEDDDTPLFQYVEDKKRELSQPQSPLTPGTESSLPNDSNEIQKEPAAFPICYRKLNLTGVENALGRDMKRSIEEIEDEVLTMDEMKVNLENYYLLLLRLTLDCPFKDVRKECRNIIHNVSVSLALLY